MSSLLELHEVTMRYGRPGSAAQGETPAVDGVSLALPERPTVLAIAGESGSGKTTMARLLLGMIRPNRGEIRFDGGSLESFSGSTRRRFRREVQAVFQDPFEVYNPFYRIDHVLTTPLRKFRLASSAAEMQEKMEEALRAVGLRPEETLGRYPHQLSGGQRQRIMIARAILLKPRVLIADEPVSMVDASLRATILSHLLGIHRTFDISIVYITHDLTTAYQVCEDIVIMYRGTIVERGPVEAVIKNPKHPYTQLLVGSIPLPDPGRRWGAELSAGTNEAVAKRPGFEVVDPSQACPFIDRCPHAMPSCARGRPRLTDLGDGRSAACYLYP